MKYSSFKSKLLATKQFKFIVLITFIFSFRSYCQSGDNRKTFSTVICEYNLPINKNGLSVTAFNVTPRIRVDRWQNNSMIILDIEKSQGTASNPSPSFKHSYNYGGKQYGEQAVGYEPFESIMAVRTSVVFEVLVTYGAQSWGWKRVDGMSNQFGPIDKDAKASEVNVNVRIVGLMFTGTSQIDSKIRELLQSQTTKTNSVLGNSNNSTNHTSSNKNQTSNKNSSNTSTSNSNNNPVLNNNYNNSENVSESQGNAPVTNSTPNFESFSTPQVYTNPLSTYTKPSSGNANLDAFSQGYQRGQEISDAVLPAAQLGVDLWNAHVERKNAEYERERIAREAAEARRAEEARIAAIEKENKRILVSNRTKLINAYPDGKTPLSSEVKGATVIYFFVYSFDMSTIEGYKPKIYISNVFPLTKSGDGTWPYKTSLMDKITQANPGLKLVLSGYYLTEKEAIDSRDYLYVNSGNTVKFKVENIVYSNLKIETSKKSNTDFLGNPINSSKKETNTNEAKVDFLGNPIKK